MAPTEDTAIETENPMPSVADDAGVSIEVTADSLPEVTGDERDEDTRDPFEVAYEARRELEREEERKRLAEEVRQQLLREQQMQAERARLAAEQARIRETFTDVIKETRARLSRVVVKSEDGDEELTIAIPDATFEEAVARPLQRYNAVAEQTYTSRVYNDLANAAASVLPESAHEEFNKRAAGKPLDAWVRELVEANAPHTEYVKNLQKEFEVKLKAAEARGFARGQKAPAGVPKGGAERAPRVTQDLSSWSGAAAALARGEIDDAQFRDIVKKLNS